MKKFVEDMEHSIAHARYVSYLCYVTHVFNCSTRIVSDSITLYAHVHFMMKVLFVSSNYRAFCMVEDFRFGEKYFVLYHRYNV
jgi:hypothetical protein